MNFKSKTILAQLLIISSPYNLASYGQFKLEFPIWLQALAVGLLILIASPLLISVFLTGKKISGFELSTKEGSRLIRCGSFHFFYAMLYLLFILNLLNLKQIMHLPTLMIVLIPTLLLVGLGIICVRLGKYAVDGQN